MKLVALLVWALGASAVAGYYFRETRLAAEVYERANKRFWYDIQTKDRELRDECDRALASVDHCAKCQIQRTGAGLRQANPKSAHWNYGN
jgi:hypothetical protein